jgi:lipid-binding SYLF domain-containing protein
MGACSPKGNTLSSTRRNFQRILLVSSASLGLGSLSLAPRQALAASAEDLKADAAQALTVLYKERPVAEVLSKKAKAILVFPKVVKAGLVFGGQLR